MGGLLQSPLGCPVALSSYTVLLRDVTSGSPEPCCHCLCWIYKDTNVVTNFTWFQLPKCQASDLRWATAQIIGRILDSSRELLSHPKTDKTCRQDHAVLYRGFIGLFFFFFAYLLPSESLWITSLDKMTHLQPFVLEGSGGKFPLQ